MGGTGTDLVIAWFLGAGGLVVGVVAGMTARSLPRATVTGLVVGGLAGCLLSVDIMRDVQTSSSSTSALGMLLMPVPPFTNAVGGLVAAAIVRGWRAARAPLGDGDWAAGPRP